MWYVCSPWDVDITPYACSNYSSQPSQKWHFLAPSINQKISMRSLDDGFSYKQASHCSTQGVPWDSFALVLRPNLLQQDPIYACFESPTHAQQKIASRLEALPAEILSGILEDSSLSHEDILRLGLASQTLWQHACHRIHALSKQEWSCWSGIPILLAGTLSTDAPPVIYDMYPELRQEEKTLELFGPYPARRWICKTVGASKRVQVRLGPQVWLEAFERYTQDGGMPFHHLQNLRQSLEFTLSPWKIRQAQGAQWILRNLNTKEIVRLQFSDAGPYSERIHVAGSSELSLDKALMIRISWGDDLKGPWAGHRFEVDVLEDDFPEDWTDVTSTILMYYASS